jgi:hypothetical protein
MSQDYADEVEEAIRRLQERGEYEQLATPDSDRKADRVGWLLAQAEELSDEDVELLLASAPEAPPESADQLIEEVLRTVGRPQLDLQGQSPLERLRSRRKISVGELVDALVERFELERGKRRKVRRYYEELEAGLVDPVKVDQRVWEVIAERLHESVEGLLSVPQPRTVGIARVGSEASPRPPRRAVRRSPTTSAMPGSDAWDEVDELFRGGDAGSM